VQQIGFDGALRTEQPPAVPGQKHFVVAVEQNFERTHVIRHAAFGRRDDRRIPGHHVIA